ncbi:3-hydroxyacyl-CoA dehydrogenase [Kribbella sp. NPDC049174]|uniref:3-hydroxyacyl-CoA dehydrogenase n=1 Tax=Kribbella sp. NPDC049174 TaxID=3364112 RepID=UPI00371C24BC
MTARIEKVAVLGTGVLGSQIAYQAAYSGFEVTAYDISDEILEKAKDGFEGLAARYVQEVAGASDSSVQAALTRIRYSSQLEDAVRGADLVVESAPERLDIKRGLYAKLGPLAPKKAIFVTNSSTLMPSDLADATGRPERFLALHFANQIWVHNTAEIMGHADTDPDVYKAVVDFARRIGMVPIELRKEQPGYVVNSLQVPFLQAAQALVVKGVADPETVDKAWRTATGAPHGPFQALDVIGLTTVYNIDVAGDEESLANARYLKEHYIDQGKLGRASGEGFYKYGDEAA